jgi:hypothetical protein
VFVFEVLRLTFDKERRLVEVVLGYSRHARVLTRSNCGNCGSIRIITGQRLARLTSGFPFSSPGIPPMKP